MLNKPFADVSEAIGLGYSLTQSGMRRTFNDLARAARVQDLVTRSISGHLTERMQRHYSTVRGDEQRAGIANVIELVEARKRRDDVSDTDAGGRTLMKLAGSPPIMDRVMSWQAFAEQGSALDIESATNKAFLAWSTLEQTHPWPAVRAH